MKLLKKTAPVIMALLIVLTLCACSEKETELHEITFVLDWTPNTNHTGLYTAIVEGYFEEAGLKVTVVQPPEDGAEMLVASGKAQFGVSFQDYLAPAYGSAEKLPITAVAAVLQHNTSGIISLKGRGMDTPRGLEGKKYATWDLPIEKATMKHVIEADGGDFGKVELIPSTVTDEVSALKSGSVDAIWIYYGWAGVACELAGLETDYFAFSDIDPVFDFYTPVIIANDEFLEKDAETAKKFMSALKKGYEFAAQNPEEAADILISAVPELSGSEELVKESQKYLSDRYIDGAESWGVIDTARWDGFFTWLWENELIEEEIPSGRGFTNDFLSE